MNPLDEDLIRRIHRDLRDDLDEEIELELEDRQLEHIASDDRERTQGYLQRYVTPLPVGGEIVLFDRSGYDRAGVEPVMGFCSDVQYEEFSAPRPSSSACWCARASS